MTSAPPRPSAAAGEALRPRAASDASSGSEAGRAFLQERLALFAIVVCAISALFYAFALIIALSHGHTLGSYLQSLQHVTHVAGTSISLGTWLVTRRGARSLGALRAIDAAHILLILGVYAVMVTASAPSPLTRMDLVMTLIALSLLTTRAIIVPSTPERTLALGAIGSVPALVVGALFVRTLPAPEAAMAPHFMVYIALWCVAAVIISTLASRVIFGLRREVAQARRFGQYILEEKIGAGGMGSVYRARHALLRRPTAVKLLPPDRAGEMNLSRFEREVHETSRLTHPNTVAVYDFGRTEDGIFYYAMEYLEGLDLERLVSVDGPQAPERVVHILLQVCGALTEAHAAGLVHRDIKPANIILCERGGVPDVAKVVDFGLVKDLASADPKLSQADSILGTPLYIAPESLESPDRVDARSDLYSLGGVAYYLLTGAPMFEGSLVQVFGKHLHEAPIPPSERLGSPLPRDLEKLVLACLEKDPERRPQSAEDFADALRACNVAPWSIAEARSWWRLHGSDVAASGDRLRTDAASGNVETALTVDFGRRAAS